MSIKISKAMKKLKKLKNEASKLGSKIQKYNRNRSDNEVEYSLADLMVERQKVVDEIVDLKVRIMKANIESGNYERILRIGESRGYKSLLESVDTSKGFDFDYGSDQKVEYVVQIGTKAMETLINEVESSIESDIEALDDFNAKTSI